jgi:hypothetical protein
MINTFCYITEHYFHRPISTDGAGSNASPTVRDILIAYATLPGEVAYRSTKTGSWFISVLCEVGFKEVRCLTDSVTHL